MSRAAPLLTALLAGVLAVLPLAAQSQSAGAGRITPAADGPVVLPAPAPEAAPLATPGLIQLPPDPEAVADPAEGDLPGGDDAGPSDATGLVAPPAPPRDSGASTAASGPLPTEGLMPLLPLHPLPGQPLAGASLPEPGILRLTGERLTQIMTIYLPDSAPIPEKLVLTLQSSINVLPDAAQLEVTVNDAAPRTIPLDQIGAFGTVELAVSGLRSGDNRVALNIRQPHRIWCGPEATFGVWTEVDLSRSGAPVPGAAVTPDRGGFALALRAQTGTGRPLAVLSDSADPILLRKVTDRISEAMGGNGQITLRSFYTPGPKSFASVALIPSERNQVSFRPGSSGALVMQIEHRPGELPDLSAHMPPPPPPGPGLQVLRPGNAVSLGALGHGDVIGNTHYFRAALPFRLPDSWLLLANQRARLQLHYGYSAGLAEGAILLVKVNEQTVRLLPLDVQGGRLQKPLDIDFQARFLHGGVNILSFEMMVPGEPADAVCQPRQGDMLVVLASSTLDVPPSPPMELAGLIRPLSGLDSPGVLPAEGSDGGTMALTAARISAGMARPPRPDPAVRLYVTDISTPAALPAGPHRLRLSRLQEVLFPVLPATAAVAPETAAPVAAAPVFRFDGPGDEGPAPATSEGPGITDWFQGISDAVFGPEGALATWRGDIRDSAYIGSRETLESWLEGRHGVALLMRPDPATPDALWLVLGPRAPVDMIAQSLSDLRRSRLASGEAALLDADGTWSVWSPITPPNLLAMPAPGQWRTVLGNFASWSPLLYTGLTLGLALLSILPVIGFLLITRTRRGGRG
ncbi:cellulose biosynthesis cyclic di-GMP-binding regulatory protein BcsB [Falsigemmobacter faecalis]|uniref:Cyclic di-GMP-binding protein n=1 Tax=Falsigemmobacter faecalis TaxID=2488730 RepID=A0A3P3DZ97_9RHOB|nr:cellulose biosynthesis cyclic di-GMP-binding regulatory protein BcsB [Falsigemmobacter faecalis]RRH78168.1 hypothetical protein EG244_01595 [Falsigemmobacter faecalis]